VTHLYLRYKLWKLLSCSQQVFSRFWINNHKLCIFRPYGSYHTTCFCHHMVTIKCDSDKLKNPQCNAWNWIIACLITFLHDFYSGILYPVACITQITISTIQCNYFFI
jgi:hypothetical protein